MDQHLLAHVRPPDWRNPEAASLYDLVVIGGGTVSFLPQVLPVWVRGSRSSRARFTRPVYAFLPV